jgi:hypothetical protein
LRPVAPLAMAELVHRRLRAPEQDGAALIDPPLNRATELVARNQILAAKFDSQVGFPTNLRLNARRAAVDLPGHENGQSHVQSDALSPVVMAGHQPELFHPGVWFKNFVLSSLQARMGGQAINLIVDTDTVRRTAIPLPIKTSHQASIEQVAYDASGEVVPFEERVILDPWLFESFNRRVLAAYSYPIVGREAYSLLLEPLWSAATSHAREAGGGARLGAVLSRGRHELERHLGLRTAETPLSRVAQTPQFRWFALYLLTNLPRLWRTYNAALAQYRQVNRIRSSTHPVAALQERHDWLEAPFFLWTRDNPRRRPIYVIQQRAALVLSDREGTELTLEASPDGLLDRGIEQLAALEQRGIKLRPRALITTMYARLILCDLFIHGIGGAKYDELTDLIIRRFFGIEPPAYITATATFRLPIERPQVSPDEVRAAARRIRDMRYRPESALNDRRVTQDLALVQPLSALAAEKRDYLAKHDLRHCSRKVFERLDRLNGAMHQLLRPVEEELRAEHQELLEQFKQSQVLGSREFSFVLYPAEILPARLLALCAESS